MVLDKMTNVENKFNSDGKLLKYSYDLDKSCHMIYITSSSRFLCIQYGALFLIRYLNTFPFL